MVDYLVNGKVEGCVNVADRGLSYGDGLFETIAIRGGVPLLWDAHLQRMKHGAARLKIPFDNVLTAAFLQDFQSLLKHSTSDAVLKLTLTRGVGARGYWADPNAGVTRIAAISAMPDMSALQALGISVRLCSTQLARQPLLAGIKHLNRLEQVLARSEWDDSHITEGIVSDTQGNLIEGCMSNLFWLKDNVIYTPDLSYAGVVGVVRETIINLSKAAGLPTVQQGNYQLYALLAADEVFVCNSVFNILPVTKILGGVSAQHSPADVHYHIGPTTQLLQQLLQRHYLEEITS